MKARSKIAEHVRAYRQRQEAAGYREIMLNLPVDTIAFLDEVKERRGLRNRSQAFVQLIEQGRQAAQKTA
ncbi:hypothetical protein ICJ77_16785 [Acidiphilium multivorum]|nr:hypothetical protein [Acidiphilium multivorum]